MGTCHDVSVEDRGQLTRVRSLLHWVPEIKLRLSDLGEVPILAEISNLFLILLEKNSAAINVSFQSVKFLLF